MSTDDALVKALEEATAYARDRKLDCRRDAACQSPSSASRSYELIGMANAFAEMSQYLYRALSEARRFAAEEA